MGFAAREGAFQARRAEMSTGARTLAYSIPVCTARRRPLLPNVAGKETVVCALSAWTKRREHPYGRAAMIGPAIPTA